MNIIGYTYEADVHCVACTLKRFGSPLNELDCDREGNPLHPLFSTDRPDYSLYCGDCGEQVLDAGEAQ